MSIISFSRTHLIWWKLFQRYSAKNNLILLTAGLFLKHSFRFSVPKWKTCCCQPQLIWKFKKKAPYWLSKFFPHFGIENGVASPQYVGWSIFAIYGFAIVPQFSPHSCRHVHRIFISISDLKPNVLAGFYNFPVWCYWQCYVKKNHRIRERNTGS